MPRSGRVVVPGCPHHVTQRGNNRQDVFFVDDDQRKFIELLRGACSRFGLLVEGYCLMPNHVHLVATPKDGESLQLALKWVNQLYAQRINRLHDRCGHLWQDRFFSCALDDGHYWTAMAYVERNPVRAKLVRRAWAWPWSSAAAHCGGSDPTGLLCLADWRGRLKNLNWREALTQAQDNAELEKLRLNTSRGRPLGSDSFLSKLECALGRRLRAMPHGRPRKEK